MNRKIVILKYGESVFNEKYIFEGGDPNTMLPISFVFCLIQEGDRNILIDVGCNDGAGFVMSCFCKPAELLKNYGIAPEEVTDVVITHHHRDHIEAIGSYRNAVIYMQKEEYQLGKKFIPSELQVHTYDEEMVLGEGILVKRIGGHSVGSAIVLCECQGMEYVFCGDECYVKACLEQQIPTGSSYNPRISRQFVEEYGKGKYEPILFHDPDILRGSTGYLVVAEG